jgi:hypothetical protein
VARAVDPDDYKRLLDEYERLRRQSERLEREYRSRLQNDAHSPETRQVYSDLLAARKDAERVYADVQRTYRALGAA